MVHPLLAKKNLTFNKFLSSLEPPVSNKQFVRLADKFLEGDHWYKGIGYIGPIPTDSAGFPDQSAIFKILKTFVSRNVVKETMRRGVTGLLGNEPAWLVTDKTIEQELSNQKDSNTEIEKRKADILKKIDQFIEQTTEPVTDDPNSAPEPGVDKDPEISDTKPPNETVILAETLLKTFWQNSDAMEEVKRAVTKRLVRGYGVVRIYIPDKYFSSETGELTEQVDLQEAIDLIKIEFCDEARVLDHQGDKLAIIAKKDEDRESLSKTKELEISFVDDDNKTWIASLVQNKARSQQSNTELDRLRDKYIKESSDDTDRIGKNIAKIAKLSTPLELGGRLTSFEISGESYCTDQLIQNNKLLNLNLTMSGNTTVEAGFSELALTNVELAREDPDDPNSPIKTIKRGGGVINNFMGVIDRDEDGNEKTLSPSVHYKDPAPTDTFIKGRDMAYTNCLEETSQLYVKITGDATATAVSRIQAREEFLLRMEDFKPDIDRLGSWLLITVLNLCANLAGTPDIFNNITVNFECRLSAGKLTPEERRQIVSEVKDGVRSMESARMLLGIYDPIAEQDKIELELYGNLLRQVVTQSVTNRVTPNTENSLEK